MTGNAAKREKKLAEIIMQRDALLAALELTEASELAHANCDECEGEVEAELCQKCFPLADDARVARRAAIKLAKGD